MHDIVILAQKLMNQQCDINGAPSKILIELAVKKGIELSENYKIESQVIAISLYLAHTVFSPVYKSEIQEQHPSLSADFASSYLDLWGLENIQKDIIKNAILAHHNDIRCNTLEAEIVKNAECFKFVSIQGALIWLHELGLRGVSYNDSRIMVIEKMEQKIQLLTLQECIVEAQENCHEIRKLFKI